MPNAARLEALDLNVLVALHHLLDTGSVTAAARRLGTTQPSVSRTLGRLRALFGDPLLVPSGRRMELTAHARDLEPRVRKAVAALLEVFGPARPYALERETFTVRIAATDYAVLVVLRPWLRALRTSAPGVTVHVHDLHLDTVGPLARGELDLACATWAPVAGVEQFVFRPLLEERYVCVLRPGHPAARQPLTLRRYLALDHIAIACHETPTSPIDRGLESLEQRRPVVVTVPTFLAALSLVAKTDLAATVPERLVNVAGLPVRPMKLPFPAECPALHLVWHPRYSGDPRHRALREHLQASVREIQGSSAGTKRSPTATAAARAERPVRKK